MHFLQAVPRFLHDGFLFSAKILVSCLAAELCEEWVVKNNC